MRSLDSGCHESMRSLCSQRLVKAPSLYSPDHVRPRIRPHDPETLRADASYCFPNSQFAVVPAAFPFPNAAASGLYGLGMTAAHLD